MRKPNQMDTYVYSLFDELSSEEELLPAAAGEPGPQEAPAAIDTAAAELQIRNQQKTIDYNIKDYPVEVLVSKFTEGQEEDENEFFVPYYQRDFTWDLKRQSRFIESLLLGLPIPPLFLAGLDRDISEDEGRLEIVDGSQRIRTLERYLLGQLKLKHLDKLKLLNGTVFKDLELSRQRKFKRHIVRVIELSDKADEDTRKDLFERINTGSDVLKPIEVRRGAQSGPYFDFLDQMADHVRFKKLVPVGPQKSRRKESQELLLRFFAYYEDYMEFHKRVDEFLTDFIAKKKDQEDNEENMALILRVLDFVERVFPNGFRKGANFKTVPRVRFEALAVGSALALKERPEIENEEIDITKWINSEVFKKLTTADGSNSAPRLRKRIEFVRDHLLNPDADVEN